MGIKMSSKPTGAKPKGSNQFRSQIYQEGTQRQQTRGKGPLEYSRNSKRIPTSMPPLTISLNWRRTLIPCKDYAAQKAKNWMIKKVFSRS